MLAAQKGYTGIVKLLLRKGAKVDAKGAQGRTALIKAASLGKIHIVKALLAKKAKMDGRDTGGKVKAPQKSSVGSFKLPEDMPAPSSHAALLAIYNKKGAKLADLAKYVKAKGWISGDSTIYGSKGRKGISEKLISLGLARKEGDIYTLTDKGSKRVNPESILESESEIGSYLHKQLLVKTIEYLHEKNMFVMATP